MKAASVPDEGLTGALRAYRIVRKGYAPFDGTGAYRRGGRWNTPGRYVIYGAQTYSLAVLENLVHFNLGELPPNLVYVELTIAAEVSRERVEPEQLKGWNRAHPNGVSERFGDRWHDEHRSAVLLVPSMLSPKECNVVIHPGHPQASRIGISAAKTVRLDTRVARLMTRS